MEDPRLQSVDIEQARRGEDSDAEDIDAIGRDFDSKRECNGEMV